jgi:hypothetical protein
MTLQEIKTAIDNKKEVRWNNDNYHVIKDNIGQYLIICQSNYSVIGLTYNDGITLNGEEKDFFIKIIA